MPKKIPQRMCSGCGEHKPKKEMLRVVRLPSGEVELDKTGKKSGRGAYVCPQRECLQKARRAKRLERMLEVCISQEVYDRLEKEMETDDPG